ncbi:MAG TPA: cytochrome c peroxidase [Xanthobacteraceae bacterium]
MRLPYLILCIAGILAAILGAAGAAALASDTGLTRPQAYARAAQLEALGRKFFFDPTLSASGRTACATCHDPQHAFGPPNALAVQLGGKDGREPGLRAVPSLRYLQADPQFTEHYFESDDEGDDSVDNGPTGGLTWDGRVDRGRDQARIPLLSPYEMANDDATAVTARVRNGAHADELRKIFGDDIFADNDKAFAAITQTLEVFQQDFRSFYPYSSKYDAYLAGRAQLTAQEARGLAAFSDPAKGNCGNCHRSAPGKDGTPPQFTDYGLIALGVPRSGDIPANTDPHYFDLGACGPLRTDLAGRGDYCGRFITPTLRNVALRRTFFHNGKVHTLREAIAFYAERDSEPEKWYPRDASGRVLKYDDLPEIYRDNVNMDPPFGGKPGDPPALSATEIDDVIAFLNTLTDGYGPAR